MMDIKSWHYFSSSSPNIVGSGWSSLRCVTAHISQAGGKFPEKSFPSTRRTLPTNFAHKVLYQESSQSSSPPPLPQLLTRLSTQAEQLHAYVRVCSTLLQIVNVQTWAKQDKLRRYILKKKDNRHDIEKAEKAVLRLPGSGTDYVRCQS